eukprot:CAMPEP_0177395822 /NCGR_PEP_ID=MMETSP0368-20130122/56368_1 /TAXON_ID=447022 ORGANISM="Scrippsiella hangoei-like, Strain SHHI-4" /NCGR_SAMPLE_ID=MMETSP0368 /ASSEMBLY_ACC=CAM_ASM_000363 /LENGTH=124 /DNA_ID=CAMNT_0018862455 /DNA_START=174 /DNA_END=544 /DNA_ORIENTATION=-
MVAPPVVTPTSSPESQCVPSLIATAGNLLAAERTFAPEEPSLLPKASSVLKDSPCVWMAGENSSLPKAASVELGADVLLLQSSLASSSSSSAISTIESSCTMPRRGFRTSFTFSMGRTTGLVDP